MRKILLLTFLAAIFSATASAQDNSFGPKPFVINYLKSDYEADNQNWSVATDHNGMVYFGNHAGLLSFDGSNWEQTHVPEQPVVRSVMRDDTNRVYVGAYEEFGYFEIDEKGQKTYFSLSDSISQEVFHNDEIWRIIIHQEKVYFQSFNAIFVYDGHTLKHIAPGSPVVLLLKAGNRLFIHRIGQGLLEIIDDKLQFVEGSGFLKNDEVKMMVPLDNERFVVGAAKQGLFTYNGDAFKPWKIPFSGKIKKAEINCGVRLPNTIAIGTIVKGIFVLNTDGSLRYHLNAENSLQNNTVLSMARDSCGNMWAGLDKGIDYIDFDPPMDFYVDKQGALGAVYAATLYNNTLWIGTNRGLYRYENHKNNTFSNPVMIDGSQGQVWSLNVYDGQLICGHNNGTYRITGKDKIEKISDINGGFHLRKTTINQQTVLLQSTYSSLVVYKKKEGLWSYHHAVEGFLEPVPTFEIDHKNNIWASHLNKGVFKIRLSQALDSVTSVQLFDKQQGLLHDRKVQVSKVNNRIVFATGHTIYTYDDLNDSIVAYNSFNTKASAFENARKIFPAMNNRYWFINRNRIGLFQITGSAFNRLFNYNLQQQGLSMSSEYPEIITLRENMHLICFDNGFAIYNQAPPDMINSGKVLMRQVSVKDQRGREKLLPLQKQGMKVLKNRFSNITFAFSTTEKYVSPQYRYKLKGLGEDSFSGWKSRSKVTYNRLPPGEYVFIVQSRNVYDKVSNTFTYGFKILPPWYGSNTAVAIYVMLFVAMAIYFRYIFRKRLRKHTRKLEQQEREKREREQMLSHQQLMRIKNEKLEAELKHKNVELANHTMNLVNKNDLLMHIKTEIKTLKMSLGPRFPNYHYRQLLKTINQNITSEDEWKTFEAHFDQIHENFFKRLMEQYPELTQSDLKLCAYLRMNLATKEIAPLLNISVRGVEARRYRLRKRLNLDHDANLVEFLLQF